jgi:hypothetical protein
MKEARKVRLFPHSATMDERVGLAAAKADFAVRFLPRI